MQETRSKKQDARSEMERILPLTSCLLLLASCLLLLTSGFWHLASSHRTSHNYFSTYSQRQTPMRPLIVSHAGYAGLYPENSLLSIKAAMDVGADVIEIDMHLTKDNHIVIHHDGTVDRNTDGKGVIAEMTLDEIKRLDAGVKFGSQFAGEKAPTLEEVAQLVQGSSVQLLLEIKRRDLKQDIGEELTYIGIEERIVEIALKYNILDQVGVASFSGTALKRLKEIEPRIPTSYDPTREDYEQFGIVQHIQKCLSFHANILSYRHQYVTEKSLRASRLMGVPIWAWTIDDPPELKRLIRLGVDGILTNRPDVLKGVFAEMGM
jgi:glycerophosphoryl diester phosphodiesterase